MFIVYTILDFLFWYVHVHHTELSVWSDS